MIYNRLLKVYSNVTFSFCFLTTCFKELYMSNVTCLRAIMIITTDHDLRLEGYRIQIPSSRITNSP